jgi:predicted TIM-barrel fold metal-dependent hydrolase
LNHAVIVHPEPYQDDHRYTEYCLEHEPSPGFFKATCLFDPVSPETPGRMQALVKKYRGRIVALRIHEMHEPGTPPAKSGLIRDRDLRDPQMLATWRAAHELGLAVQLHFIPHYAEQIGLLVKQFPQMPVVLDHLARPGQGTAAEYEQVLALAKFPEVVMKYSSTGLETIHPAADQAPLVKRVYEVFGPDRVMWGCLGGNNEEFAKEMVLFDEMFAFAPENARARIRGLNAQKLFGFD